MNQDFDRLLDSGNEAIYQVQTKAPGPAGSLPLTDEMLRKWPSGDLFGLTQNAAMGWTPQEMLGPQFLLLSTQGGVRGASALGTQQVPSTRTPYPPTRVQKRASGRNQ